MTYILCDVNGMYASCEKVFDPAIRKKPVVVLTNNDGCVAAACGIAKQLDVVKKFVPYYQIKEDLERAGVVVRSSNYELYGDLSQKFMDVCTAFAPDSHVYSIDECFLYYGANYHPPEGWEVLAKTIRRTVWRHVRLPIGVGVGKTPTLAKAANHAAKRIDGYRGIAVIDTEHCRRSILAKMAVTDVWGIGRRLGARLNDMGIFTALDLANAPPALIRKRFSVTVESTVLELNGVVKLSWDEVRAPKKEIYSTRSFGQRITDKNELRKALITHVSIAAQKLRKQQSVAGHMLVFASNSPHDQAPYYRKSISCSFPAYTSDTQVMARRVSKLVDLIYRPDVRFYRCGIGLMDLATQGSHQQDLFKASEDNPKLMVCMDRINSRYGRGTIQLAAQGIENKFAMRREFLSPQYTTRLSDLPVIHCD